MCPHYVWPIGGLSLSTQWHLAVGQCTYAYAYMPVDLRSTVYGLTGHKHRQSDCVTLRVPPTGYGLTAMSHGHCVAYRLSIGYAYVPTYMGPVAHISCSMYGLTGLYLACIRKL